MGLAYGDTHLVAIGSTLLAMEIHLAQTWWHVRGEYTCLQKPCQGRELKDGRDLFMPSVDLCKDGAWSKIRNLNEFDDGKSLTDLLWWIHSRRDEEKGYEGGREVLLGCWWFTVWILVG
ncbi:hypothetical protein CsSME_00037609 [Camellia sinensis var. sinensis]